MIRKVDGGYKVVSEGGKNLSRILKTHKEAVRRLAEVEYWKMRGGKK